LCFRHLWKTKEADVTLDPQTASLIEDTLPLVRHVVYQVTAHFPRHVDKEELVRAGVLGLVEAAHRYEPEKGVPFPSYASVRIRGAILDAVRKVDWAPRSLRRAGRTLEATADRLATDLRRAPTSDELAGALGVTPAELTELQHRLLQSVVLGLDQIVGETSGDGDDDVFLEGTVADASPSVEDDLCDREMTGYLRDAVAVLPERHRTVISGYFFEGQSSEELAQALGVTVSRVSQLRTEAFEMIRHGLAAQYSEGAESESDAVSAKVARRRGAYASAIAARSTWRSRLETTPSAASSTDELASVRSLRHAV
jgi:RNA polymerase sigma factor for flagellar operon FliA